MRRVRLCIFLFKTQFMYFFLIKQVLYVPIGVSTIFSIFLHVTLRQIVTLIANPTQFLHEGETNIHQYHRALPMINRHKPSQ